MDSHIDIIETINELFEQIYKELIVSSAYNDTDNDETRNLYYNLMKKKRAVLCASACNPMNTSTLAYELTPKQYYIEQK
jgi:hypothetical protein